MGDDEVPDHTGRRKVQELALDDDVKETAETDARQPDSTPQETMGDDEVPDHTGRRKLQELVLDDDVKETAETDARQPDSTTQPSVLYTGEKNHEGLPHGKGSVQYLDSGIKYQGEFVNGQPHGRGKLIWPDGSNYDGILANGAPKDGKLVKADGQVRYFSDGALSDPLAARVPSDHSDATSEDLEREYLEAMAELEAARQAAQDAREEAEEIEAEIEKKHADEELASFATTIERAKAQLNSDQIQRKLEKVRETLSIIIESSTPGAKTDSQGSISEFNLKIVVPGLQSEWHLQCTHVWFEELGAEVQAMHDTLRTKQGHGKYIYAGVERLSPPLPRELPFTERKQLEKGLQQFLDSLRQKTHPDIRLFGVLCSKLDVLARVPDPAVVYAVQEEEDRVLEERAERLKEELKRCVRAMLEGDDEEASRASKLMFAMLSGAHPAGEGDVGGDEWRNVMKGPGGFQMLKGVRRVLAECGEEAQYNACRLLGRFADGRREESLRVMKEGGLLEAVIGCVGVKTEDGVDESLSSVAQNERWQLDVEVSRERDTIDGAGVQDQSSEDSALDKTGAMASLRGDHSRNEDNGARRGRGGRMDQSGGRAGGGGYNLPATALFALYRCLEPGFVRGLAGPASLDANAIRAFHRCRR